MNKRIIIGYLIGLVLAIVTIISFFFVFTKKIEKITQKLDKEIEIPDFIEVVSKDAEIKLNRVSTNHNEILQFNDNKIIFINFWATWCRPCIEELPSIFELIKNKSDKVDFYIISKEPNEEIKEFLDEKKIDTKMPFYSLTDSVNFLKHEGIPRTYIIKNNVIYLSSIGKTNWNHNKVNQFIEGLY